MAAHEPIVVKEWANSGASATLNARLASGEYPEWLVDRRDAAWTEYNLNLWDHIYERFWNHHTQSIEYNRQQEA